MNKNQAIETKISISIIKLIKEYFDTFIDSSVERIKFQQIDEDDGSESDINIKDVFNQDSKELENTQMFISEMSKKIHKSLSTSYDDIFPKMFDSIIHDLETHFRENFSEQELIEIHQFVEKPYFFKLMGHQYIFSIILKHKVDLLNNLEKAIYPIVSNEEFKSMLQSIFNQIMGVSADEMDTEFDIIEEDDDEEDFET